MTVLNLTRADLLRDAAFVNGRWVASQDILHVENPADGTIVGTVPNLGKGETQDAVTAAANAFSTWRSLTGAERASILRRWHDLLLEHADDLALLMTAEQGKPIKEAYNEVVYAASFFRWFSEEACRVNGEILTPHLHDKRLMVFKQPVGIVAAITPWNFPLAMIARKAAPALAAGCTIVVKPSELTPLSALALARLGEEAGLPAGVLNVVTGEPSSIGEVLTGDPRVRKFTFTGSTDVGKKLASRCMATVKRVSLELGGNAPFIVFEDADIDLAVESAVACKFRNSGQTCICANRLLIHADIYDRFAEELVRRSSQLIVGAGLSGRTDLGPLINERAIAKTTAHLDDAVSKGARLLYGGKRISDRGYFFPPTVLADVTEDALLCREETFGPLAGLVQFKTESEAIRIANDTRAGLAAYVFTNDLSRSWRVSEALDYGMVGVNTGLISTEVAPFGGVKESGLGREGSHYGIDEFLELKTVCVNVKSSPTTSSRSPLIERTLASA